MTSDRQGRRRWLPVIAAISAVLPAAAAAAQALVPERVPLDPSARTAMSAAWLTEDERKTMRVFHGVWDRTRDLDTPRRRAVVALNAWDFDDPALQGEAAPVELRAEALLRRGELKQAVALLDGAESHRAARIRAEAHEQLGEYDAALAAAEGPVRALMQQRIDDPAALTEAVRVLVVRARIQGHPARDYMTMMELLGRAHQQLDRLYWPAKLAEARLLVDKDNVPEAVEALHETLALNPRCAAAWDALGRIALRRFDFDGAELAGAHLRRVSPSHPLADLLLAEARLIRDDPDGALELLEPQVQRLPKLRRALALTAAAQALRYDDDALAAALRRYESLSPGSARAYYVAGRHLSLNRQYEQAAEMLREAIRRQPAWPAPRIELGLMQLQSGRDDRALAVLEQVVELDPFNKRAGNSLRLLRELAGYETIETEHFVIRYQPGIDRVTAELMPEPLERIHEVVTERFDHEPARKTVIEVLPDHERFAVRITGMPWIHTIAASTGPVIAIQVPREGPPSQHKGPFDWVRVIRHEYTHTVNLSQTRNRIPHWLTEAAAVSMELAPRDYETCRLLAEAHRAGELFDLADIKWAFVRPRKPGDRALAYAQSHWMVEYMNHRFGDSALVRLLRFYFDGIREAEAMAGALGVSREQFFDDFLQWAEGRITEWGLAPGPSAPTLEELEDRLRWNDPELAEIMVASQQARLDSIAGALAERIGRPAGARRQRSAFTAENWPDLIRPRVEIDDRTLEQWLSEYPGHPDLLEIKLRRRAERLVSPDAGFVQLLERYAEARPVDPYPHKKLAQIHRDGDEPQRAIPHLEALDRREQKSPVFAVELARLYRRGGEPALALAKITRAVRINPYEPYHRELAAAIAIEAGRLDLARQHIVALTLLEPGEPRHQRRLEALDRLRE